MSTMLQIVDLLNPVTTELPDSASNEVCSRMSSERTVSGSKPVIYSKWTRESVSEPKEPLEHVNFMPFEETLTPETIIQMQLFHVRPFGQIRHSCQRISYRSPEMALFTKIGRESLHVFKYEFRSLGDFPSDFVVMWDYDLGLVRMAPLFRGLGYDKTRLSRVLYENPGLREITLRITGGDVSAQGYWMPYKCARALCATFCYPVAYALIPLFGPAFPAECRMTSNLVQQDMTIDSRIIEEVTREDMSRVLAQ